MFFTFHSFKDVEFQDFPQKGRETYKRANIHKKSKKTKLKKCNKTKKLMSLLFIFHCGELGISIHSKLFQGALSFEKQRTLHSTCCDAQSSLTLSTSFALLTSLLCCTKHFIPCFNYILSLIVVLSVSSFKDFKFGGRQDLMYHLNFDKFWWVNFIMKLYFR